MAATCWSDVQDDGTKDKRRTVAKHTGKDAGSGDVQKYLQTPFRRGRGAAKRRRKKDRKKERKGEKELRDGGGYLGWVVWLKNSLEEGQMGLDWSYVMGGGDKFVAWDMDGVSGGVVVISCQC